jgi:hypothetical protein
MTFAELPPQCKWCLQVIGVPVRHLPVTRYGGRRPLFGVAWTRRWRASHYHRRPLPSWRASSGWVRIPLEVRVYRIVHCHSKLHVRQWRAKNSRPLVHPRREKVSLRSTLCRLSRCHQTKLSSVPVRVGALTDGISDTPSVSSGNCLRDAARTRWATGRTDGVVAGASRGFWGGETDDGGEPSSSRVNAPSTRSCVRACGSSMIQAGRLCMLHQARPPDRPRHCG